MDSPSHLMIDFAIILILIVGIWRFNAAHTARSGNLAAALALLCALGVVLYRNPLQEPAIVILALLVGGAAGGLVAARVNMIQIPAMVAFQHGAGGIAAFLTSFVELTRNSDSVALAGQLSGVLGIVIGAATFSGSVVASAKLAGRVRQTPVILPNHGLILAATLMGICTLGALAITGSGPIVFYGSLGLILLSILLGTVFAIRIGGADMPVLISFLNATAGLAAAFCGVIIQNRLLIACGATVAASGSILTQVMCQAMNRQLFRVLVAPDLNPQQATPPIVETQVSPLSTPPETNLQQSSEPAAADCAWKPPGTPRRLSSSRGTAWRWLMPSSKW